MPVIYNESAITSVHLKYLVITFDRSLCGSFIIINKRLNGKARRSLNAIKQIVGAKMSQKILVILFQTLLLSVIEYGFGSFEPFSSSTEQTGKNPE